MIVTFSTGFPGVSRVFKEMERIGFSVHNPNPLPNDPDLIILGAWDPYYENLLHRFPKSRFMVLWTSPILQTEFSSLETEHFLRVRNLLIKKRIEYIWFGEEQWLSLNLPNSFYAPYPVTLRDIPTVDLQPGHVSLFGPLAPRKNVLTQLIACSIANKIVHINTRDPQYLQFAESLGLGLQFHNWMKDEEYYYLVASMEVGLQVSIPNVESFSFITLDHVMMDRPCLSTLDWPGTELKIIDHQDPRLIAWRMSTIPNYGKGWWRRIAEKVAEERTSAFKSAFRSMGFDV